MLIFRSRQIAGKVNILKRLVFLAFSLIAVGCGTVAYEVDRTIDQYEAVRGQIHLGDLKEPVLALLEPTQVNLKPKWKKSPDIYLEDSVTVEVYYFRSGRQPDGLVTDDEFTPYIFHDGVLVGIGWVMLGGPKSQGTARPATYTPASASGTKSTDGGYDYKAHLCKDAMRRHEIGAITYNQMKNACR